jgi:FkbM family methyltransferase
MISYAQNMEDVVLCRLIELVPKGVFVDVGAGHPILENPTYALYQAGWRGVNVEPMAREAAMFADERPDDVTLQVALGSEPGKITLFEAPLENRGATTFDVKTVELYRADGQRFDEFEVEVVTLKSVVEQQKLSQIHVLKIDVEGMEREVLLGADLATIQPWVVVVEATAPNSQVATHEQWEPLVLQAGYALALFDGLNRFYVRCDLTEVHQLLSAPANVFDSWVSYTESQLRFNAERAAEVLDALQLELSHAQKRAVDAETFAASLTAEREAAAPHIAVLQARAELVSQMEQEIELLRRG